MIYSTDSPEFKIADLSSDLMGGGLRDEVIDFIELSRSRQICIHGIKQTLRNIGSIKSSGVENRTPEGGRVSFWAMGAHIFHTRKNDFSLFGYDTPFFHYSIRKNGDGGIERAMAVTTLNSLNDARVEYEKLVTGGDGQIKVGQLVPPPIIQIHIGLHSSPEESNRKMFLEIYESIQ